MSENMNNIDIKNANSSSSVSMAIDMFLIKLKTFAHINILIAASNIINDALS